MLAFILPDHGTATPGAGAPWVGHPSWEIVDAASDAVGLDVGALLLRAGPAELSVLEHAHLATFVLSIVGVDAAERLGLSPMATGGYGLGEYASLVASGAVAFEEGARLVMERATAIRECLADVPSSAVAVLGLHDDAVEAACARAEGGAWVAAYDAPGRVVISGTPEGIARAGGFARSLGATDVVSVPIAIHGLHTPMVETARDRLRKVLAQVAFGEPDPVAVANVDARCHADAAEWPGLLSAQMCAPVRWRQCVDALFNEGVRTFLTLGDAPELAQMTRDSCPALAVTSHAISAPGELEALVERLITTPSLRRTDAVDHAQHASRLVVAVGAGPFRPSNGVAHAAPRLAGIPDDAPADEEMFVEVGDLIGWVGDDEIRSAFRGTLGGLLVITGERVMPSQPVAWLRVDAA